MRRALVKSFGLIHSAFRHCEAKRPLLNATLMLCEVKNNIDTCKYGHSSYIFSRAISADAAKVNYEGSHYLTIF